MNKLLYLATVATMFASCVKDRNNLICPVGVIRWRELGFAQSTPQREKILAIQSERPTEPYSHLCQFGCTAASQRRRIYGISEPDRIYLPVECEQMGFCAYYTKHKRMESEPVPNQLLVKLD